MAWGSSIADGKIFKTVENKPSSSTKKRKGSSTEFQSLDMKTNPLCLLCIEALELCT
jgi:hypothetical protein